MARAKTDEAVDTSAPEAKAVVFLRAEARKQWKDCTDDEKKEYLLARTGRTNLVPKNFLRMPNVAETEDMEREARTRVMAALCAASAMEDGVIEVCCPTPNYETPLTRVSLT